MQILTQTGGRMYLQNTDLLGSLELREGVVGFPHAGNPVETGTDQAELEKRFLDIVDALDSGDVRVYDTRKAVGYWKPKPARAKKPAAAKKAPATPPPEEPKK